MPDIAINGFTIASRIAEGRFVDVYQAHQISLDRAVMLHIFHSEWVADPARFALLQKDARRAARLKHPGILQVFDFGEEAERHYLVTELPTGVTIGRQLLERGTFKVRETVAIVQAAATALEYAWVRASLVHGHLTPESIWLDAGGVKISGIGLADLQIATPAEARTPGHPYRPPERLAGEKTGLQDDIFALGVIFGQMLSGQLPPENEERDYYAVVPEQSPPEIANLARAMTAHEAAARLTKWEEVSAELEAARKKQLKALLPKKPAGDRARDGGRSRPPQPLVPSVAGRETPPTAAARWATRLATLTAWLLALALWAGLAYVLWWPPAPEPLIAVQDLRQLPRRQPPAPAPQSPLSTTPQATAPAAQQPPVSDQMTDAQKQQAAARLVELEDDVARYVVREEFNLAIAAVDMVLENGDRQALHDAAKKLQAFAVEVGGMKHAVSRALAARRNEPIAIRQGGRLFEGTVVGVKDDVLELLETVRDSTGLVEKHYRIPLDALDAAERLRWLKGEETPARCAMQFILGRRAKRPEEDLRHWAEGSGPLKDAFNRLLDATPAQNNEGQRDAARGSGP
jgi:serine/threonine-protein kinase